MLHDIKTPLQLKGQNCALVYEVTFRIVERYLSNNRLDEDIKTFRWTAPSKIIELRLSAPRPTDGRLFSEIVLENCEGVRTVVSTGGNSTAISVIDTLEIVDIVPWVNGGPAPELDDFGPNENFEAIFGGNKFRPDVRGLTDLKKGEAGTKVTKRNGRITRESTANQSTLLDATNSIDLGAATVDNEFDFPFSIDPTESSNRFDLDDISLSPGWEVHIGNTRTKEVISVGYDRGKVTSSHPTTIRYLTGASPLATTLNGRTGLTRIPSIAELDTPRIDIEVRNAPLVKGDTYNVKFKRIPQTFRTEGGLSIPNTGAQRITVKAR